MKELVFDPLQMKRTVLKVKDALKLGAALFNDNNFDSKLCKIPLSWEGFAYSIAPSGAVWSTIEDLSPYLLVEMNAEYDHFYNC